MEKTFATLRAGLVVGGGAFWYFLARAAVSADRDFARIAQKADAVVVSLDPVKKGRADLEFITADGRKVATTTNACDPCWVGKHVELLYSAQNPNAARSASEFGGAAEILPFVGLAISLIGLVELARLHRIWLTKKLRARTSTNAG